MSAWKPTTCPVPCLPVSPHTFDISPMRQSLGVWTAVLQMHYIKYKNTFPYRPVSPPLMSMLSYVVSEGYSCLYSSGWRSPGGGESADPTWSWGERPALRVRLVLSTPGRIQGEFSLARKQLSYTFSCTGTLLTALWLEYQSNKTRQTKAHITLKIIFHLKSEVFFLRPLHFKVSQSLWRMITVLAHISFLT